ncbi:enoyl-CoA hydratase [Antarctobacter sp.]|uniref:enoyl-CoA hydratase n=1 Tax=Antarctobacter sp. TaxID=1872577 RepID=UPI003A92366E
MTDKIKTRQTDGIGWVTLDNPARRNAISLDMWQAMDDAFAAFEADPSVRVVIMHGAGGKAFAAGADISQFEDQRKNAEQAEEYARISRAGRQRIANFPKPLIAMIEGYCIGGGVLLAALADIRIGAENSVYGIPAARLGLGYPFESVEKVVGLVGPAVAKELLFTARRFDAARAEATGLINFAVPTEALEDEVRKMAEEIARNAPLTIELVKYETAQVLRDPAERDMAGVEARIKTCFESEDYSNGRRAFMEKRTPVFEGK